MKFLIKMSVFALNYPFFAKQCFQMQTAIKEKLHKAVVYSSIHCTVFDKSRIQQVAYWPSRVFAKSCIWQVAYSKMAYSTSIYELSEFNDQIINN